MHYLTLDTNTWIYLANGTEPVKSLHYIKQEVERGNITILLPDIIVKEWHKNKDKAVKQGVLNHYKEINEALERISKLLGDKGERDMFSFLLQEEDEEKDYFKDYIEKFKAKRKEIEEAITANTKIIEEIFSYKTTAIIKIDPEIYVKSGYFAIEKKAPFKNKNSFADALIVFSFIQYVENSGFEDALFITYNTEDFCVKKEGKKSLHPDLEPDFTRTKSQFFTIVGEALNTIKEDLISKEELEYIKEHQDEAEIGDLEYCDACYDNGHYNAVYFYELELVDERFTSNVANPNQLEFEFAKDMPKTASEPRYNKIEVGNCSWCDLEHFKCVECSSINTVWEHEYNEKKECQGCGLTYFVDHFMDSNYTENFTYKILKNYEVCQKCGEEFETNGSGSKFCSKCEDEYSYS